MNNLRILVTGANGFIGRPLIKRLVAQQYDVYALDAEEQIEPLHGLKQYYRQDITKRLAINQSFDFIFHLAALNITHIGKADYDAYYKVNVLGTRNLIQSVQTRNFIFMSTAKVYRHEGKPIIEASPVNPLRNYEKSKLAAEEICRKYFHGENFAILRAVNIVGPGQADKALIPVLFRNAFYGKPINIFVPKKTILQLLYVDDVVRAFEMLIENEGAAGIFNLSATDTIRLDLLARKIARMCNSSSEIVFSNTEDAVFSEVISNHAKEVFGWSPAVSVQNILARCYEAYAARFQN